MKKIYLTALLAGVATINMAGNTAGAHTDLKASIPADGAVIEQAPGTVQLSFTEGVRLTAVTIQPDGADKQSLGPLPTEPMASFTLELPKLANGHYVVSWRALADDMHVMNGEFMFMIGAAEVHDEAMDDAAASDAAAHGSHAAH